MLKVKSWHLTHSGRTKEYEMLVIERTDGMPRALLFNRWGPVGRMRANQATHGSISHVENERRKNEKTRLGNGYFHDGSSVKEYDSWEAFRDANYAVANSLTAEQIQFISEGLPDVVAIKAAVAEEQHKEIKKTCSVWGTW